jgi:hypothetical protein
MKHVTLCYIPKADLMRLLYIHPSVYVSSLIIVDAVKFFINSQKYCSKFYV